MGNIGARQVVKTRSIYHDPSIRQALQQRRFATTAQKKPQAPNPQLRVALQQRYGTVQVPQKVVRAPQDSGKVRQLVVSTGAAYRAPACDPWARGQLFW